MKKTTSTIEQAEGGLKLVSVASVPGRGGRKSLARSIVDSASTDQAVEYPLAGLEDKDIRALRTRVYTIARDKGIKLTTTVSDGKLYVYVAANAAA